MDMVKTRKDQDIFYVYFHTDESKDEIVYVGMGSGERAWVINNRSYNVAHSLWIKEKLDSGLLPGDWVSIEDRGLSKEDALDKERFYIDQLSPRFNRTASSTKLTVLTTEQLSLMLDYRKEGLTYKDIAQKLGVSTMVIARAITGETKAYRQRITKLRFDKV